MSAAADQKTGAAWVGEDVRSAVKWSIFVGEHGGQFAIEDGKRRFGCRGIFLRPDDIGEKDQKFEISTFVEPYCKEGFSASLTIKDERVQLTVSAAGHEQTFSGKQIFPLNVQETHVVPDNVDVLGVELGMTPTEVRAVLLDRHKYEVSSVADVEVSNGADVSTLLSHTFPSGDAIHLQPSRLMNDYETSVAISGAQMTDDRIKGETFVVDPSDRSKDWVSIAYVDGTVAAMFRELRVGKDALEATRAALNEKYGSFPLKRYLRPAHYLGAGLQFSMVHGYQEFDLGGGWGAASYSLSGEKLASEVVDTIRAAKVTPASCTATAEDSLAQIKFASSSQYLLIPTCSITTYFGLEPNGFAGIAVYDPSRFASYQWETALKVLSENVTEAIKQLKVEGSSKGLVPEL
jgi:hypothetical protein